MVKEHYTVINIMKNGEQQDDLTNYVVPEDNPIYDFFIKINEEQLEVSWCNTSFRNTTSNYTAVSNEFIQDKELSLKSKGLLLTILSNKENWRVFPTELANRSKDSEDSIYREIKKLEKSGYIRTYKKSLGRGKGVTAFRFCADRKISDEIFEQFKQQLDKELAN